MTSKLRADALAELASTALAEHVDTVVAFEDVAEHKPSPAPQLEAPSARAPGLPALAVTWGDGDQRALTDAGAERVCAMPDELREAITALITRQLRSGAGAEVSPP